MFPVPMWIVGVVFALATTVAAHTTDVRYLYEDVLGRVPTAEESRNAHRILADAGAPLPLVFSVLDSPEFALRVPDDDVYIVATYFRVMDREPTLHEFLIARHFVVEEGVRSLLLAGLVPLVLGPEDLGENIRLVYDDAVLDQARPVAGRLADAARASDLDRRLLAEQGGRIPDAAPTDLMLGGRPVNRNDDDYSVYYGYLHAHSNVSFDAWQSGSEGPMEAFRFAREEGGLDWMGLSDHAEYISRFFWNDEWQLMKRAADRYNEDGTFVALRGFEYSNPLTGHINVFNTPGFISAFGAPSQRLFYRWLNKRRDAVATFNHPGEYDLLGNEFLHLALVPRVSQQLMGLERLQSGDDFDDNTRGYGGEISYLEEAQESGWYIGPFSAQDNHSNGWGITDSNRTGVWATELTRDGILDGLKNRRFFATTDPDLVLSFRVNGSEMGSILPGGALSMVVHATDPTDSFSSIEIWRDLDLLHEAVVSGTDVVVELDLPAEGAPHRYHAFVIQDDGGRAMSTPVWVERD